MEVPMESRNQFLAKGAQIDGALEMLQVSALEDASSFPSASARPGVLVWWVGCVVQACPRAREGREQGWTQ